MIFFSEVLKNKKKILRAEDTVKKSNSSSKKYVSKIKDSFWLFLMPPIDDAIGSFASSVR